MTNVHVHLVGGPMCGQSMSIKGMEPEDGEYEIPEAVVIPVGNGAEMYLLSNQDAPCGFPTYLYAGYDWEPGRIVADLDGEE